VILKVPQDVNKSKAKTEPKTFFFIKIMYRGNGSMSKIHLRRKALFSRPEPGFSSKK
jgi:hypothetical protein